MTLFPPPTQAVLKANLRLLHGLPEATKDYRIALIERQHVSPVGRARFCTVVILRCNAFLSILREEGL